MKKKYVKPMFLVETFGMGASNGGICNTDASIAHEILKAYEPVKDDRSLEEFVQDYLDQKGLDDSCHHTCTNAPSLS